MEFLLYWRSIQAPEDVTIGTVSHIRALRHINLMSIHSLYLTQCVWTVTRDRPRRYNQDAEMYCIPGSSWKLSDDCIDFGFRPGPECSFRTGRDWRGIHQFQLRSP